MNILISNANDKPIYEQICTQIKNAVLAGALRPGDALPSIRSLAKDLRVSVITTKRAYEELERDGFIENFTGRGCFVKAQNTDFLKEESMRQVEELLAKACEKAQVLNLSLQELQEMLELMYRDGQ